MNKNSEIQRVLPEVQRAVLAGPAAPQPHGPQVNSLRTMGRPRVASPAKTARCHSLDFATYFLIVFALCTFCAMGTAFGGEIRYAKVLDTAGTVEVLTPPHRQWVPLEKNTFLKKGTSVRTHAGGHVWMAFDAELNMIAELDENSYLNIWTHPPSRLSLKNGRFSVFREVDLPRELISSNTVSFKVLTREMMIEVKEGGFILEVSKKGSLVKVFAESLTVFPFSKSVRSPTPKRIAEGFKFFRKSFSSESFYERMRFPDYAPWKTWIEKAYELKDDWASDRVEKDLGP